MASSAVATFFALFGVVYLWIINNKVNQDLRDLQYQLLEINKQLLISDMDHPYQSEIPKNIQDFAAEIKETKRRLKAAEIELSQCNSTTALIVAEIEGAKYNLSEAINRTKTEAWKNITRDKEETAKYISTNFMSHAKWFPIIGTGLLVDLLLVILGGYHLYSNLKRRNDQNLQAREIKGDNREAKRANPGIGIVRPVNNTEEKREELQSMKGVLSRIKPRRLLSKVCVLSLYHETINRHVELTKSAIQLVDALHGIEIVTTVITKHEEVLDMPACKTIVMYVDYNQRNVILEDTRKVLGDLKLTTARAILKFNADLVLVYVGHKGSKELGEMELFSRGITLVQLHPDLREISQKQRFLSVYKEFTKYQKEHLCEILQSDLL